LVTHYRKEKTVHECTEQTGYSEFTSEQKTPLPMQGAGGGMRQFDDFDLELGTTRTVDQADELAQTLAALAVSSATTAPGQPRPGTPTHTRPPLTFADFSRLVTTGTLTKIPTEGDPFIYRGDGEFAKTNAEIRATSPHINPEDFRRLRRGFLLKRARDAALHHIDHEKEILTHLRHSRPLALDRTPVHSDYVAYLAAFHSHELEAFFRPWVLPVSSRDLKAHCYIAAGSGHGKSELIKTMLYGLLKQRQGCILFDPHGDIAEEVTRWKEFKDHPERLIYFYPYLAGRDLATVPVLNPLSPLYQAEDLDSAVENFIAVLSSVVGGDWDMSSRMKLLLRPCLYSLAKHKDSTLYDVIAFMAESPTPESGKTARGGKYRANDDETDMPSGPSLTPLVDRAKKELTNRALLDTLATFFDRTYDTTKAAIRDRLRTLLSSNALDRCLGGTSTIDLAAAMDSGKFIVFNLSAGMLGEDTSNAFGRFLLASIQNMAMRRQAQGKDERRPVFTFIDEADRYLSESVKKIVKETRKYGLHLAIAQQITGAGMNDDMRRAIFGNSFVRIAGAPGGDKESARDMEDLTGVPREEIKALARGEFYAKRGNLPARKFTVSPFLMNGRNTMNPSEWETVKAYQLTHHYRAYDATTAPAPAKRPINTEASQQIAARGHTEQGNGKNQNKPKDTRPPLVWE
jgi:hypothetical protein